MSTAVWADAEASRGAPRVSTALPCLVFVAVLLARLAVQYGHDGGLYIEDDAYYYDIVARHIAETGRSTFDGQTLTNGYHPLWLLVLVAKELVFGASALATIVIEIVLATIGLWGVSSSFRSRSVSFQVTFALAYGLLAWPMIAKGMEVSLLLAMLGLFVRAVVASPPAEPWRLAALAALCIGARIDAAFFVVPMLVFALGSVRRVLPALALLGLAGAVYAAFNLRLFGLPLPVSGEIKSLGGLQLNTALADQIAALWSAAPPGHFVNSFIGRTIVLMAIPAAILVVRPRGGRSSPLTAGFVVGSLLFVIKLGLLSSWEVWPWYAFPALIGLAVVFHALDDWRGGQAPAWMRPAEVAAMAAVALAVVYQVAVASPKDGKGFTTINQAAVARFAPIFQNARVAMGDRAGSLAFFYRGPVTQLEGLVNDKEYFDLLKHHGDIKPLLCRRGVRFVLSYQTDLGAYDKVEVPALRHRLTHFPSPTLTVSHTDEVGRVFDLGVFDNRATDVGDNYLYAWRLSGCDTPPRPAS